MFNKCHLLLSLNLAGFHTSKVENMAGMFSDCNEITNIDNLNYFDTSLVTNMEYMFNNCHKLLSLNLAEFRTSKVKSMAYMFNQCNEITNIDNLNNFDTSL